MTESILVIENDLVQRGIISETLQQFTDYDFVIVDTAQASFEIMERLTPTLIIIDWELPEMAGNEFVSKIRKLAGFEITPILIITARDIENHIEEAIQAGATDYIRKPISKNILNSRLKVMLRLAKFQEEQVSKTKSIEEKNHELIQLTKSLAKSNRKFQKSERRYRALAENFPNGVIGVYNKNLEAMYLSGQEFSALGIDTTMFIGKTLKFIGENFIIPNDKTIQYCQKALKGGEQNYETEYSGNYYTNTAVPLPNEDGEVDQVMIVAQNITKAKATEKKLMESIALIESVAKLIPHFIYTLDLEKMEYIYINRNPLKSMGYSDAQAKKVGYKFPEILFPPEDYPNVVKYLKDFVHKEDGEIGELVQKVVDGEGNERWFWSTELIFKRNEEGIPTELIGSTQDITPIKEYEQKLLQTNLSKDRVLATVAHDLRGPIQNIKGMLGLMERSMTELSDKHKKLLGMVKISCNQATDLISELLEMSEMEDEEYQLATEEIALNDFINQTIEPFKLSLEQKELNLKVDFSEEEIYLQINKTKFSRVIENLLTNAQKFTSKGGQITVSTQIRNENALISIADDGIGIAQKMQSVIFDKFSKASRMGLEGEKSTGLGMSIVKQIVELHKGKIWLKSEEGKGTQFLMLIPRIE